MDKTFAFCMIGVFALCALSLTWAIVKSPLPQKNTLGRWIIISYDVLMWICIVLLLIITIIYK